MGDFQPLNARLQTCKKVLTSSHSASIWYTHKQMDYITAHKEIYDSLATEYESRNEKLLGVTKEAVNSLSSYLKPEDTILELGCGSGLAAKLLQDEGFKVSVIELSSKMIQVAKKITPSTTFIQGNFLKTDFSETYNAIFALAFIHLFPKADAISVLKKSHALLRDSGILYIGTTKESTSSEGWQEKVDYETQPKRYRKHWMQSEFEEVLKGSGFEILDVNLLSDPFGKVWMDYIVKRS